MQQLEESISIIRSVAEGYRKKIPLKMDTNRLTEAMKLLKELSHLIARYSEENSNSNRLFFSVEFSQNVFIFQINKDLYCSSVVRKENPEYTINALYFILTKYLNNEFSFMLADNKLRILATIKSID